MTGWRGSLRWRLAVYAAGWAGLILVAGAVALSALYASSVHRGVDDHLEGVVDAVTGRLEVTPSGVRVPGAAVAPRYANPLSGRYWAVFSEDGRALAASRSWREAGVLWDGDLQVDSAMANDAADRPGRFVDGEGVGPQGERLHARAKGVSVEGADGVLIVVAARDRAPIDASVRTFTLWALLALTMFAAALVGLVFAGVQRALSPILQLGDDVAQVRQGVRERVGEDTPRELAPVAQELNALLDHNHALVERARADVGNLAHALKTPLSVLRNEADARPGPLAELVSRQTGVMAEQVDHHLKRAQLAARAHASTARTPVGAVLNDLARTLPRMHVGKDVALEVEASPGLLFRGERQDFEEIAGNLLDNAYKWTQGRVTARAAADGEGRLQLIVEDDGPGLPANERASALRRGVRLDETAPGTGLGLAIVNDLARAHGGQVRLDQSSMGGLRVDVRLPAAASDTQS